MKYTKYFSGLIKNVGVPNLSPDQMKRMMNIVHLEGRKEQLQLLKNSLSKTSEYKKFDFHIITLDSKIDVISGDLNPEDLIRNMMELSEN